MKLTQEHVGKDVYHRTLSLAGKLLAVYQNSVWFLNHNGPGTYENSDYWELVEEPKLPSQRIREKYNPLDQNEAASLGLWIKVIVEYLDEVLPPLVEKLK